MTQEWPAQWQQVRDYLLSRVQSSSQIRRGERVLRPILLERIPRLLAEGGYSWLVLQLAMVSRR